MSHHIQTLELDSAKLEVSFDYSPSTPDVFYLPNGDPGYPGEPESIDLCEVFLLHEIEDDLSEALVKRTIRIPLVKLLQDLGEPGQQLLEHLTDRAVEAAQDELADQDDYNPNEN